jgi:two-component system sensor histidine kinase ChiS
VASVTERKPLIVVINDDTPFLELMEELLEEFEGFSVKTRKEWHEAYEYVKEVRPDLVILDLVMGHEERGWKILELLTLDPETRLIPVIVCSADVVKLREAADVLGQHGIRALPKPFDLDDLVKLIHVSLTEGVPARA